MYQGLPVKACRAFMGFVLDGCGCQAIGKYRDYLQILAFTWRLEFLVYGVPGYTVLAFRPSLLKGKSEG